MINLQSDKPNEYVDDRDESLQTFSKTCSIMFGNTSIYEISSINLNIDSNNGNSKLPYEPTAVLANQRNTNSSSRKRISIYDILNLDFSR